MNSSIPSLRDTAPECPDDDRDHTQIAPLLTNNGGAICTAAENGLGIALLPTFIAGQALRKGKLERLLTDYGCPQLGIYAVYPSNRHLSAKVRSFIDFLVTEFSDPPRWDKALFTTAEAQTGPD